MRELVEHPGLAATRLRFEGHQRGVAFGDTLSGAVEKDQLGGPADEGRFAEDAAPAIVGADDHARVEDSLLHGVPDLAEVEQQGGGGLVAVLGVLGEESLDDFVEGSGHVRSRLPETRHGTGDVLVEDVTHRVPRERRSAGERLEQHDAGRVEVGAFVDAAVDETGLLRGRVAGGAEGNVAEGRVESVAAREAEVDERDVGERRLRVHDDVRRFDVAVQHPVFEDGGESFDEGLGHGERVGEIEGSAFEPVGERDAGDERDHEVEVVCVDFDVEQRSDVRAVDLAQHRGFVPEQHLGALGHGPDDGGLDDDLIAGDDVDPACGRDATTGLQDLVGAVPPTEQFRQNVPVAGVGGVVVLHVPRPVHAVVNRSSIAA